MASQKRKRQMDYYTSHTRTVANSIELAANLEDKPHFPDEGLLFGSLKYSKTKSQSMTIYLDVLYLYPKQHIYLVSNEENSWEE